MRTTTKLAALAAAALMALTGSAQARHGADDPAGHVRHGHGADDGKKHQRHHGHGRHRHRHNDDGPNHS